MNIRTFRLLLAATVVLAAVSMLTAVEPTPAGADEPVSITTVTLEPPTSESAALTSPAHLDPGGAELVAFSSDSADLGIEVRVNADGTWTEWEAYGNDGDEAPDDGAAEANDGSGVAPIWIGAEAQAVEVRLLDASAPVEATLYDVSEVAAPAAALDGSRPAIHPRSDWTSTGWSANTAACGKRPDVEPTPRALIVHHTVNANSYVASQVPGIIASIKDYHTRSRGWCDIAYNFLIDRFGGIWEGRTGSASGIVVGGHARGFNIGTVGVALIGTHAWASPTAEAAGALKNLASWRLGRYGVDPQGTTFLYHSSGASGSHYPGYQWVEVPTVVGHGDLVSTECPGAAAGGTYLALRGIDPDRVGNPPYSFPDFTPRPVGGALIGVDRFGGLRPALAGSVPSPAPAAVGNGTVIAVDATAKGGYLLTSAGKLVPFGGAGAASVSVANPVDIAVRSNGRSGWVLGRDGKTASFGGAPNIGDLGDGQFVALAVADNGTGYGLRTDGKLEGSKGSPDRSVSASDAVDVALRTDGTSGWVVGADGRLHAFGGAAAASATLGSGRAVAVVASVHNDGGWIMNSQGQWHQFGAERRPWPQSSTVGFDDSVDGDLIQYRIDESYRTTTEGGYVDRLAGGFLGVNPTATELDLLDRRLETDGTTTVITEMAYSQEFAGAIIDDMYADVLGRAPDSGGRAYWLDRMRNGLTVQRLGTYFYASEEYVLRAGSNRKFVTQLYTDLLDRAPDENGINYWTNRLESGRSGPANITSGFFASEESRRKRATRLFQHLVGTPPPGYELPELVSQIASEGDLATAISIAKSELFIDAGPYPG